MRSVTGFVYLMNGAAFHWGSRKQKTDAKSSSHAEYVAASVTTEETCIFLNVMEEISVDCCWSVVIITSTHSLTVLAWDRVHRVARGREMDGSEDLESCIARG
jgi:hypothetical protein